MDGPFNPDIMPVKAQYHYNDVTGKWTVKASRQIKINGTGARREYLRETFDSYEVALSAVSIFFGNA